MEMNVRDNWFRLSPATRQWFTDNPGCVLLPRTLVATINTETNGGADSDEHGQTTLSEDDRAFIRAQLGPDPGPEHVFFDAARP
ncbi:hypothetical protein GCM10023081_03070 [Arthrobacter ginkgonis]|uniref:Uncharacterized protein n=1 Tax=Arthrobacter ginkgonis TaxID=1630594 RepID=A0ABP7BTD7_9MICC